MGQRDDSFSEFISLGNKKNKDATSIFEVYSRGSMTSKDAWLYNTSKQKLYSNTLSMVSFYNKEVSRYKNKCAGLEKEAYPNIEDFFDNDPTKISWDGELKVACAKGRKLNHDSSRLVHSLYRPFFKQWYYSEKNINLRLYQIPKMFPERGIINKVIALSGIGTSKAFSAIITDTLPDIQLQANGQCFPLMVYEPISANVENDMPIERPQGDLFSQPVAEPAADQPRYTVKDGISDAGLAHFQAAYPTETLSKEDLFYYIYGLLHSEDYKTRYADNLTKELPRIPAVKQAADFWAFSKAGRELAELHVNYETQAPYPVTLDCGSKQLAELQDKDFYVTKMKFASKGDKSTVVYNHAITIKGIPLAAYDYVVNGKPALEWVMERQGVSTHKDSGIVNDANDWAIETMKNARYPLELFQRVITVSLRTMEIVRGLPGLGV